MTQADSHPADLPKYGRIVPLAIFFGVALGLFASGYWLADLLPANSRQLLALTVLAVAAGVLVFYFLLQWARSRFWALSRAQRLVFAGMGLLTGLALMFGGTSQWRSPARYESFILPAHRLQVSITPGTDSAAPVSISWFNTSLGDISFETIDLHGWSRKGDELILETPADNRLQWVGRTGETVQMVFRGLSIGDVITISWDSHAEIINPGVGKFTYLHTFQIPWYASKWMVLGSGILITGSLALVLVLLLWENRANLLEGIAASMGTGGVSLDRRDAALAIGIILLALLLRLPNLGTLFPAVDEYYHLIAARQITEGAALSSVYQRGLWLVTLPVSLALRWFGYQFWAARLMGVLFNVLAIVPLYLVAVRVNRPVAVIAGVLYATSPWIVTFARIAREYAFYPFYFYWIVYGMLLFIEEIPHRFVLLRDWKHLAKLGTVLLGLGLAIPPLFAYYGDLLSTFRAIWIAYLVFAVFLFSKFDFRSRMNLPVLALLGGGVLLVAKGWYQDQKAKISLLPHFNSLPVEYFLPNPQQQWYFDRLVVLIVIGLLGVAVCGIILRRRNILPVYVLALFLTYLAVFALFATTFYHTRHLSSTELWYVIVVGIGLYIVWKVLTVLVRRKGKLVNVLLAAVLGLSVINVKQILVPITSTNPDNPISQDYLHDLSQVHTFMLAHVQPHEVLISTVYGLYASWEEEPSFEEQYRITTQTPRDEIFSLIDQHQSGWIVIDKIRLALSTLGTREFAGKPDVEYIGLFGDEYVWHWQHSPGSLGRYAISGKEQ